MRDDVDDAAVQNRQHRDGEHRVHGRLVRAVTVLDDRVRLAHVQIGAVNHRDRDERAVRRGCPVAVGAVVLTVVAAEYRGFTAQQQGLRHGEVVVDAARRHVRGVGDAQHGGVVLRT